MLGRRAFALESAAARVCREAGARVTTNVMVRDLDLVPQERVDGRRLEVVADGLPLFHGAQLAVHTTVVAPLKRDGTPQLGSVDVVGPALVRARPRIDRRHGRDRLVVLACETGEVGGLLKLSFAPRTATSSHQRQVGLAGQVEHDFGVQWCSCFGVVLDGGSCCCWTRRPNTFHR